jgi:formylglycine-generating enzyme required for sulfatase activity
MLILLINLSIANDAILFSAGSFQQGSGVASDESPRHLVTLDDFYLDRTEVNIQAFELFVKDGWHQDQFWSENGLKWRGNHPNGSGADNRSAGRNPNHPVVAVTWYEADAYCKWKGGALPTEAQWERAACPANGRFAWGDDEQIEAAWYSGGKYGHLQSVLTKETNQAAKEQQTKDGLYHTTGNVWEWTADWYHAQYYQQNETLEPTGPETGRWKTMRGGSFMNLPSYCSCTHREPASPDRVAFTVGFRCAYLEKQ